ncbi:Luc7-related [Trinorchestia longiramus]|nr:Luc7-related [Trinorchestia longiramus]
MSAHDQMKMMLDQLMGTTRNGETNEHQVKFTDPRVCKSFLLACCPHEILSSTRMDLGDCPNIHDVALRADYEAAVKSKDYYYDIDAMEHLQSFINDCDRRTEASKKRLEETQEELSAEVAAKANKVHDLAEQIGQKLAKAEQLGADSMVEESMKLMEEVEDLRKRKATAEQEYRNSMPVSSYQQQKLRVCEVCSAYLGIHDNDRRLADHFGGKLHLGFIKIREKLDELKSSVESRREKRREDRDRERSGRDGDVDTYRSERVDILYSDDNKLLQDTFFNTSNGYRDRSDRHDERRSDRHYSSRDDDRRDRRRHRRSRSRSRSRDRDRRRRRSRSRDRRSHRSSSKSQDGSKKSMPEASEASGGGRRSERSSPNGSTSNDGSSFGKRRTENVH